MTDVARLIESARRAAARSVNAVMTATYWAIGGNTVEEEQRGAARAGYGDQLVISLSRDLRARFGRGFGRVVIIDLKLGKFAHAYAGQMHLYWRKTTRKSSLACF